MNSLKIIYFLFLNPNSNWEVIVSGQLAQLNEYGILNEADLHIHITDCFGLSEEAVQLIFSITPSAIMSFNYENQFEYPGIKLVYDLAIKHPASNFIYFHAKGMSHNLSTRSEQEVALFTHTFKPWKKAVNLLTKKGINKVGLFPAVWLEKKAVLGEFGGWVWYNFWYAKGEYIANCQLPPPDMNRYYYESWLAKHKSDESYITNDCKSLFAIPFVKKDFFTPSEADFYLKFLIGNPQTPLEKPIYFFRSNFVAFCFLMVKKKYAKAKRI